MKCVTFKCGSFPRGDVTLINSSSFRREEASPRCCPTSNVIRLCFTRKIALKSSPLIGSRHVADAPEWNWSDAELSSDVIRKLHEEPPRFAPWYYLFLSRVSNFPAHTENPTKGISAEDILSCEVHAIKPYFTCDGLRKLICSIISEGFEKRFSMRDK